jgi:hypothetical protein
VLRDCCLLLERVSCLCGSSLESSNGKLMLVTMDVRPLQTRTVDLAPVTAQQLTSFSKARKGAARQCPGYSPPPVSDTCNGHRLCLCLYMSLQTELATLELTRHRSVQPRCHSFCGVLVPPPDHIRKLAFRQESHLLFLCAENRVPQRLDSDLGHHKCCCLVLLHMGTSSSEKQPSTADCVLHPQHGCVHYSLCGKRPGCCVAMTTTYLNLLFLQEN